jgi:hypothetical protein
MIEERCHMSRQKFDENCRGCRPVMIDVVTGELLPDTHPHMMHVLRLWHAQPSVVKKSVASGDVSELSGPD